MRFILCCLCTVLSLGAAEVASDAQSIQPIAVGAPLPSVMVTSLDGAEHDLATLPAGKPLVLVVFRGAWCPFCQTHLAELAAQLEHFQEAGVRVMALAPDGTPALTDLQEKQAPGYQLLADPQLRASRALGLAFQLSAETMTKYQQWDLPVPIIDGQGVLPVPAVIVSDAQAIVRFVHSDPDYRKRLSIAKIQEALALVH